ncbi:MAG: class B sortase [Lachnospiraceae bacterium]|nr:class B sortase [Lachnospiraceae bacterium]
MEGKPVKKAVYIIGTVLLSLLVLFCGYQMVAARIASKEAESAYGGLAEKVGAKTDTEEMSEAIAEAIAQNQYPPLEIDMDALKEMNEDFRGWLYFPALDISYPIVQGEDNNYYLKHSFEGERMGAGCIFMDCGASPDWSDRNTFVFGHNMRDESMFGSFKRLMADPTLCQVNTCFYIYTRDYVYTYEIFAFYETKSTSDRYMTFTSDENYDLYVKWALENTEYRSEADLSERGNIVSLSTCYGSAGTSRRMIIHGTLTATENYE